MAAIESAGIIKVHCEQLFIGHMIEIIARFLNIFHAWVKSFEADYLKYCSYHVSFSSRKKQKQKQSEWLMLPR